jgi:hypothetical protein
MSFIYTEISSGASLGSMSVSYHLACVGGCRATKTYVDDPGQQGDDGDARAKMEYGWETLMGLIDQCRR